MLRIQLWVSRIQKWLSSPNIIWLIVGLGILRTILLVLAYPPARGSDGLDYYLYAMRIDGYNQLEMMSYHVSPLYPHLIHLTYNLFGSGYFLVALQLLLAISITPLFYLALRPYDSVFAFFASLIIGADVQFHIVFNFIASEALYVYLLALMCFFILRAIYDFKLEKYTTRTYFYFIMVGNLATALFLTRPPAKAIFIPIILILLLCTRAWKPLVLASVGMLIGFALYLGLSVASTGEVEGFFSGLGMVRRAASEFSTNEADAFRVERPGNGGDLFAFIENQAAVFAEDLPKFVAQISTGMVDYLGYTGQQVGFEPKRPSEVQCESYPYTAAYDDWITVDTIDKNFDPLPATSEVVEIVRSLSADFRNELCPEWIHSDEIRWFIDSLAARYRSVGRPFWQILIWYPAILGLVLAFRRFRPYFPIVAVMMLILLYHAFVSAVVSDIQPRYVVVMNPMRITLLIMPLYFFGLWLQERYFSTKSLNVLENSASEPLES